MTTATRITVPRAELPLAIDQTVVRAFGKSGGPRHVGAPANDAEYADIAQPYRLLCNGLVVDVMAYGSPEAPVSCAACIAKLRPEFATYGAAARYVGKELGVTGLPGGWIYANLMDRPLTQGWSDFIGRWAPNTLDVVKAQEGQVSDYGRRYRVNLAEVNRLAAMPAWRRLRRLPDNHCREAGR
jgi:hypothetical protein